MVKQYTYKCTKINKLLLRSIFITSALFLISLSDILLVLYSSQKYVKIILLINLVVLLT